MAGNRSKDYTGEFVAKLQQQARGAKVTPDMLQALKDAAGRDPTTKEMSKAAGASKSQIIANAKSLDMLQALKDAAGRDLTAKEMSKAAGASESQIIANAKSLDMLQALKDAAGRDLTAKEMSKAAGASESQIIAYAKSLSSGGSSSGGDSGSTSSSPAASSSETAADKNYKQLSRYSELTKLKDPSSLGLGMISKEDLEAQDTKFNSVIDKMGGSAAAMEEANKAFLGGKLPGSVTAQIRQMASETAQKGGLFGQAASALSARDLGLAATDLMQKGIENESKVAAVREAQARLVDTASQFKRQYNNQTIELTNILRNTDLDEAKLDQATRQFNSTMQYNILTNILDMAKARGEIQANMAANDIDPSGVAADFTGLISSMQDLLRSGSGYQV